MAKKSQSKSPWRQELVTYLQQRREVLGRQWVREMRATGHLQGLTQQEIEDECRALFDLYVDSLGAQKSDTAALWARTMARREARGGEPPRVGWTRPA